MQLIVLSISLILMAIVAYFFISAVRASKDDNDIPNVDSQRSQLIWALLAFGAIITPISLWQWPHAIATSGDPLTINATGHQWYWEIDKESVPAGKPVVFNVHAGDVTHGLGVVDSSGRLLFQTQAMPGYVNKVEYTFNTPGTYKIICMDFCGIAHHNMISEFEVTSN